MEGKGSKILVTVIVVILFIVIFGAIVGTRGDAGQSGPGFLGLIVFAALIGAISAVWKKKDGNNDKNDLTKQE